LVYLQRNASARRGPDAGGTAPPESGLVLQLVAGWFKNSLLPIPCCHPSAEQWYLPGQETRRFLTAVVGIDPLFRVVPVFERYKQYTDLFSNTSLFTEKKSF
jgi:hypothetical protein